MEIILEIVASFVVEIILGIIGETLVELGFHSAIERTSKGYGRVSLTLFVYVVLAMVAGYLSLLVIPKMGFPNPLAASTYFVLAPIVAGLSLCGVHWLLHRGIARIEFFQPSKFMYGALFVIVFSVTRAVLG